MNNFTEKALLIDIPKLKAAHNNLANKTMSDLNEMMAAIRQCAAAITVLQRQVSEIAQRQGVGVPQPAPQQPGRPPPQRAQVRTSAPVATTVAPQAMPDPVSSWASDEEDADLVE